MDCNASYTRALLFLLTRSITDYPSDRSKFRGQLPQSVADRTAPLFVVMRGGHRLIARSRLTTSFASSMRPIWAKHVAINRSVGAQVDFS